MAVGSHDSPWGHTFPGKVYSNREAEVFAGAFQTARPRSNSLHAALASFEVELHGGEQEDYNIFIIVGFLCWISVYIFPVEIPKLKIERCQLAPL